MNTKDPNFYRTMLAVTLLASVIIKLAFTVFNPLSLFTEEAQYWLWSKNLDWNYYSKPLMIALYNKASTFLLGDTEVAVRFNALLFTSAAVWLVFELSLYMFKKALYAFLAAAMLIVMPFFHLASLFHTTDSSLVFFWALGNYLIWRAIKEQKTSLWLWAGVATAFGILSKNVMVLIVLIVFLYLLIDQPKFLLKKDFYLFVLVSSLSFLPILIWNINNDFVTFRHVGTLGGVAGGSGGFDWAAAPKYMGEYVGGQLAAISLFFLPFLILGIKRWKKYRESELLFIYLPVVLIWVLFLGVSVVKRVEINWPAFAYVPLPIAMAHALSHYVKWKRYASFAIGISGLLLILIMYPAPLDALGFKKVLRPQKDPFYRTAGYQELGSRVDFLIDSLGINNHFVFSDSYHIASELAFYMEGHPQTYNPNLGRRKNQFDLWPGLKQFENKGYQAIFVKLGEEPIAAVNEAFDKLIHEETQYGEHRGEKVLTFKIQVFEGFQELEEMDLNAY